MASTAKRKRDLTPDPDAEVIALSPETLTAINRYICVICNKEFQRDHNLQMHLRTHNLPQQLLQQQQQELERRAREEEEAAGRKRVYICPEPTCDRHDPARALGDPTAIKMHYRRKHGEKKWKCGRCEREYAVEADWKTHSKTCGRSRRMGHRCGCGSVFSRKNSFIAHRAFCDALAVPSSPSSGADSGALPFRQQDNCSQTGKIVVICQFGGEFVPNYDGTMLYMGGEAHAMEVDRNTNLDDFKSEIAEMGKCDVGTSSIKYFLPGNKRTPITVSNDKDLQRMIDFHKQSATIDVYIVAGDTVHHNAVPHIVLNTVGPRGSGTASRTAVVDSVTPISSTIAPADPIRQLRLTNTGEKATIGVGQEFDSAHDFRDALRKYSMAKSFVCIFVRNESGRLHAKCKADGCPWRIHASKVKSTQKLRVRSLTNVHTCGGVRGNYGHPLATKQWLVNIIKDKLRSFPLYKTQDIVDDLHRDYGVSLKYHQVRHGKQVAKEQLQSVHAQTYNHLPWFCEKIRETNPGSRVTLATTDDSRFHRLFVSFHASQHGFEHGCRPLIFLNWTSLKDMYWGTLLVAASVDADDGIFPIAFAIVEDVTYDSWHWFLVELKSAVSKTRTITFVSDRHKGLAEAVPQVFEDSYHAYSLRHLIRDFQTELTRSCPQPMREQMSGEFRRAAHACRVVDFNSCIENMKNVSPGITAWVLASTPEHWSNVYFRGSRYDHVSVPKSITELFVGWISEERELSVIKMVDVIRCKMMEMICSRREAANRWSTTLTHAMEQKLRKEMHRSQVLNVVSQSGSMFEVRDDTVNIVNLETWECTCQRWQIIGLPCMHAVAVFDRMSRNSYDYCSGYYTLDRYRLTYSKQINPVPDVDKPTNEDVSLGTVIYPPRIRRIGCPPPGQRRKSQRKKKRIVVSQEIGS
ncbi:uncharacterized protein LOC131239257 [Magnolia sinica]|uniref:uncharacterized protein LOC131239257 n=1 Tax=Magnolia sinica TaxID=86752 RepID=UPI0026589698|nr:uncharacterized protein LOC131239257 [Magnolia sinica]